MPIEYKERVKQVVCPEYGREGDTLKNDDGDWECLSCGNVWTEAF